MVVWDQESGMGIDWKEQERGLVGNQNDLDCDGFTGYTFVKRPLNLMSTFGCM